MGKWIPVNRRGHQVGISDTSLDAVHFFVADDGGGEERYIFVSLSPDEAEDVAEMLMDTARTVRNCDLICGQRGCGQETEPLGGEWCAKHAAERTKRPVTG